VNAYLLSLLFGIVEGLTEFLPVSSTAHIRITQFFCGVSPEDEFWKMYAVVIQLGAILAVVVYFWQRILKFITTFPRGERGERTWMNHPLTLVFVAFVVTAGPAYLLKKMIEKQLESPYVMGWSLIIGGVVMWVVDAVFRKPKVLHVEEMSLLDAVWIGAAQILSAIFPGTSRSMSTIAAGQVFGLSRAAALEFSFFLSIPTMFAACGKEMKDFLRPPIDAATGIRPPAIHVTGDQWAVLALGLVVSFVVAWAVIAWFMNWVRTRGFVPFAIYRIIAGGVVLALASKLAAHS
jgi:undecaprenyl-diphosphatase